MQKFVTSLLALVLSAPIAFAQTPEKPTFPERPYQATSQFFRDLVAPQPMENVRPITQHFPLSTSKDVFDYDFGRFGSHVRSVPLELGIVAGSMIYVGFDGWKWGNNSFHFEKDCWFCRNAHTGGMDKLGHMYSTFFLSDILTQSIKANAADPGGAEITGTAIAFGLMTGVEVLDGFTKQYGFSRYDLAADAIGASFALARNLVPGMREKIDFRLMYTPADYELPGVGTSSLKPVPPYRRQRYILALKGSGFEAFRDSPMRYLELHAGYDARGYSFQEQQLGYPKRQSLYVGIGLNLNELIFGKNDLPNLKRYRDTEFGWAGQEFFEMVQVPYTAVYNNRR